jgi:hypothetical protein
MGNRSLKSLRGHTKDDEVARYKADANRSRLNDAAIEALSTREYSTLKSSGPNGLGFQNFKELPMLGKIKGVEARAGIEPACKDLQSSA